MTLLILAEPTAVFYNQAKFCRRCLPAQKNTVLKKFTVFSDFSCDSCHLDSPSARREKKKGTVID